MGGIKLHWKYLPLLRNKKQRYWLITGGRGSAKSYAISTAISKLICKDKHVILFTRWTMKSAHISIIPEFKEKIDKLKLTKFFQINKEEIIHLPTGNKILFRGINTSSGNQTANLKSIEGLTIWIIDEAEELECEDTFDTIDQSIRIKGQINRVIMVMNPSHKKHFIYQRFFKEAGVNFDFNGVVEDTLYVFTSWLDNVENLSRSFMKLALKLKKKNLQKYLNRFKGHWLEDAEGSLWKQSTMIDCYRVFKKPDFQRIVIGLDPNNSSTGNQDECGLIVAGMDCQWPPHYYIIHDSSGDHTPATWAKLAVAEYKNHNADSIIPEVNNGGDLVKMAIKNIDHSVKVSPVHATRGKIRRAEPIAGLYEEGRVHHIGYFPELELQLTTYTGDPKEESPGRFDAAVWAITELSQNDNSVGITEL